MSTHLDEHLMNILSQCNLPSFKVYENGTVSTDNVPVTLNKKKKLNGRSDAKYTLYYCTDNPNTMLISTRSLKVPVANELLMADLSLDGKVIYDSLVDNSLADLRTKAMFIYNSDVNMSKGKLISQCLHVQHTMTKLCLKDPTPAYKSWETSGMRKVVLKAPLFKLLELSTQPNAIPIHDAGYTEIPSNTLTVVGFPPMYFDDVPEYLRVL